jgi:hypothetical protein
VDLSAAEKFDALPTRESGELKSLSTMMKHTQRFLTIFCVVLLNRGLCAEAPIDIPLSDLAPALVKQAPVSEFLQLVGGRKGRILKVSNNLGDGFRIDGISVAAAGVGFRMEGGGVYPLLSRPIPDLNMLAKAVTLNEAVELFLGATDANHELEKFFRDRNSVAEAEIHLSQTGDQYVHRLGAIYVRDGRIVGVRCTLWYAATAEPRGADEKISKLSIESWISADISKLK